MGNKNSTSHDGRKKSSQTITSTRNDSRKSCPFPELSPDIQPCTSALEQRRQSFDTDQQLCQLSPYQKTILREAWQRISKKGTSNIGGLIFRRMMSKNADIKRLFQHVTGVEGVFSFGLAPIKVYRHHSVLFVKILDSAINNLDDLRALQKECVEYGEKHSPYRRYGFSPDMWDVFGECMTEAAREWEGWKKHREILRAWTIIVSFIVDRMRQGYENAIRKEAIMNQLTTVKRSPSESDFSKSGKSIRDGNKIDAGSVIAKFPVNAIATDKIRRYRRQSTTIVCKSTIIPRSKSASDIYTDKISDIKNE